MNSVLYALYNDGRAVTEIPNITALTKEQEEVKDDVAYEACLLTFSNTVCTWYHVDNPMKRPTASDFSKFLLMYNQLYAANPKTKNWPVMAVVAAIYCFENGMSGTTALLCYAYYVAVQGYTISYLGVDYREASSMTRNKQGYRFDILYPDMYLDNLIMKPIVREEKTMAHSMLDLFKQADKNSLPNLKALTNEQKALKDTVALQATKQTIVTAFSAILKDVGKIDKPTAEEFAYYLITLDGIRNDNRTIKNWVYVAVVAAFSCAVNKMQASTAISCAAYFIGTQGYVCESFGVDLTWIRRMVETMVDGKFREDMNPDSYISKVKLRKFQEASTDSIMAKVLPTNLVRHLAAFDNPEELALEVCRIMMLGPKSRRAEDAQDALINAWTLLQKNK